MGEFKLVCMSWLKNLAAEDLWENAELQQTNHKGAFGMQRGTETVEHETSYWFINWEILELKCE